MPDPRPTQQQAAGPPPSSQLCVALHRQAGHPDAADAGAQVAGAIQDLRLLGLVARRDGQVSRQACAAAELLLSGTAGLLGSIRLQAACVDPRLQTPFLTSAARSGSPASGTNRRT